ncbi:hypothetical protein C5167_027809 [Papaver somniferum]|nr:hypothetical protein C5167_027809 [Papaver somniferum]
MELIFAIEEEGGAEVAESVWTLDQTPTSMTPSRNMISSSSNSMLLVRESCVAPKPAEALGFTATTVGIYKAQAEKKRTRTSSGVFSLVPSMAIYTHQ